MVAFVARVAFDVWCCVVARWCLLYYNGLIKVNGLLNIAKVVIECTCVVFLTACVSTMRLCHDDAHATRRHILRKVTCPIHSQISSLDWGWPSLHPLFEFDICH